MKQRQRSFDLKGLVWGGIGLLLFLALVISIASRQALNDFMVAYQYRDDTTINTYAKRLKTTDRGTFLLRASRAEVNTRESFNKNCAGLVEQTVVLGCYSQQRIYVYDIHNPQLDGIKEVTMAHEMLHAAYERLDSRERFKIDELVAAEYGRITDERFRETVKSYEKLEPGEQHNELHSMLATEHAQLGQELEQYYARYFTDRKAVVATAQRYESVFRKLETTQKTLVSELEGIARDLETAIPAYEQSADRLMSDIDEFNRRADSGAFNSLGSFNAARSGLVARQSVLEAERERINASVARYNAGKQELDALNLQAADLHKSIDSISTRKLPTL